MAVDSFFEWDRRARGKQPYCIRRRDKQPIAFAGIWERWRNRETGEVRETCAIVTTAANELLHRLHDRMPIILDHALQSRWLYRGATLEELRAMLQPTPADELELYPVATVVNNARNNDASLLQALR
jgi:putative SOS response-associated peptidase YedK